MSNSLRDMLVGIKFDDGASKVIDKIDDKMNDLETQLAKVGKEMDKTEQNLKVMSNAGVKATTQVAEGFKKSERNLKGFSDEVDDSQTGLKKVGSTGDAATDKLEQGFKKSEKEAKDFTREVKNGDTALGGIKKAAAGLAGIIAGAFAIDKIKDFTLFGIEYAAGTKALNSQFDQVFTGMEDTASTTLNRIAKETGILPDRLKGSYVQMAAFAKTTGADTAQAMSIAERATLAAADSAAFYDRDVMSVTENLQSLLKGNFENDSALGLSITETTRNAKALELYGKKYKDLNELQKQNALLTMVEDSQKATKAVGQAARESDGYENVIGNFQSAWDGLRGTMMTPFLDVVTDNMIQLTQKMQGFDAAEMGLKMKAGFDSVMDVAVPTFNALKDGIGWLIDNKDTIITIGSGLAAGFVAFKAINIGKSIFDTVKGIGSIGLLANPIGLAAVAIGGLVTAGVYLYKNWDTVKEKAGIMKQNLSNAWGQIKENVGGAMSQVGGFFTGLKDKAVGLWETIKQNPMSLSVIGPIGAVIGAGISLYQNWDNIKLKAGELWATMKDKFAGIKQSVSNFVQPAIGWFDSLSTKWSNLKASLSNFKMPGWVSSIGGAISGAVSKAKGLVDGSHATGLASVPRDNYVGNLHKNESILTAPQSNALRSAGILSANSNGTPNLDLTPLALPVAVNTGSTSTGAAPVQISVPIEVVIQGNADDASIQKLLSSLDSKVREVFESIFREKLAGMEG
ncbi:hypothetical protein [Solibacillus isronensis]|uniref:hypothetical protein n=1 Tax=Solibacillus isronensis TaxID=412383 RepID=UPI0039A0618C